MDNPPSERSKKSSLRYPTTETEHGRTTPHDKDPSLPTTAHAGISANPEADVENASKEKDKTCKDYIYNKETNEYCGRTCRNWIYLILYALIYVIFLATYTLIFLYFSLLLVKNTTDYRTINKVELLTYSENGIGLTVSPAAINYQPIISYKQGNSNEYQKYVTALDKMLKGRNSSHLGPCGKAPYGYGEEPCVIVKIVRQFNWIGVPVQENSTLSHTMPSEVKKWTKMDKNMLWLQCNGYHDYDKEHIGAIKYYPDPPGFDSRLFPLGPNKASSLVAVQLSKFTLGISLTIECKLWYDTGPSAVDFMLYVPE